MGWREEVGEVTSSRGCNEHVDTFTISHRYTSVEILRMTSRSNGRSEV
jgi:hypothetical protein